MFRLAPSTMMTLAAAALLAATASAQPGVLVFADVEHRGALLRTPGSAACAETEGSAECAPMEPFAAAAAVAALLRVTPVQPVDARASSRVQSLLHRDPTRRPGVVLVARLTSASPEKAMEVFLGGDDTNRLGGVARQVLDVRHVGASLDALACSRWVTHVRVRTEGITDASEIGGAVASAVADAFGDTTKKSATLVELDFDVEDDLDLDKTREALRDARDALGGPGGGAVVVLLVTGVSVEGKRSVQSVKRRRLSQDENDAAASAYSYSNGNATRVQEKTDSFRDSVTMAAVFGILLVTALCGILAMTTMTFPSDSLLYPREKNE